MPTPVRASVVKVSVVDKRFGGAHALRGVSMTFESGDVHAIAGENGAGKSTLMKILSGLIGDYDGTVEVDGVVRRFFTIRDAERHGVSLCPRNSTSCRSSRLGSICSLTASLSAGAWWTRGGCGPTRPTG